MKLSDACLKRKRVVSEPVGFSVKRRQVTGGGSSVVLNGSNTVSSHGEQLFSDLTNGKHHLETSTAVKSIRKIKPSEKTSHENHTQKSDKCPLVSSEVKRCLLTQELSSEASIEPCYLLNQRLWSASDLLTRLEWSWGMEYNSLDPRSESNKTYLRRDWFKSFDSERWLLLPTPEMAEKVSAHQDNFMRNLATQSILPSVDTIYDGAETFEYRMLSLEDVELRSFNRIEWHDSMSGTSSPGKRTAADQRSTRHYPPFYTLPPLISRAKPHFVICDTAAKLRSVWHGHDFFSLSMSMWIESTYKAWSTCEVPSRFASTPRVLVPNPPLYPYLTIAEKQHISRACTGPCINSRSAWIPTRCLRCSGWSKDFVDNPNSARYDRYGNLKIGEQSNPMALYRAYLGRVARYADTWNLCCVQQVKKRGRWTSGVVNMKQLGTYAQEPPGSLEQREGTHCAGCCCYSIRAQPVRCDRGVQTLG
ncbi:hypothetical protein HETIRDRAFT_165967 [Heterobasidion irregulare TC 32-1]|uniref:Uncharacterized protein n=1 Tax=Heterobasidion irregulare (strain TC 32-1) TaxID=747525 RepID=W4KKU4_HETIT|nr:uncharacterized protein HETIRDRAFT_165967 [Heterobasidion irregulare TC 32-1]ETW86442.1 hypothetical protein HETIRDRAFT_165967 [Heterobasidion irregulare TC 32-1]